MYSIPHPIPYQGSKRRLASAILRFAPPRSERLIEPFAGSAAISVAAAARGLAKRYLIGERLDPLARLWDQMLSVPEDVALRYEKLWLDQMPNPREHFLRVRAQFNSTGEPVLLLYLLARCVKNAVRFNPRGEFNQSADHRRRGMRPEKMRGEILGVAKLLGGRSEVVATDYRRLLRRATARDLIYMDPPYQGVSEGRDRRYVEQLDADVFFDELERLNSKKVRYLVSFDGYCGTKEYGAKVPEELGLARVLIDTGRSSQATLAGRSERTRESLYISPSLASGFGRLPEEVALDGGRGQISIPLQ